MKKYLFMSVILALCVFAYADVSKTDITFESVQPASQLATLLRNKIDDINAEIDQKSLNVGTGNIFYVDSAVGSDSYVGTRPEWALESLDAAFGTGYCTADNGDVVYVMQGHTETKSVTGALFTADVAGVTVICLGNGDNRAKFTLSHTGAKIDITADNVRFSNFYLDATGVTSVNTPLNITGEGCVLDGFFIRLSDTNGQADLGITIGAADGDANDLIIANGVIVAPNAGAVSAISFVKDMENVILSNLHIYGDYSTAVIDVTAGGNAQVNLQVLNSTIISKNTDEFAFYANGTGNTGAIVGCTLIADAEATILDAGGLQVSNTDLLIIGNAEGAPLPANTTLVDLIGDFTGPDDGAQADDNIKALLDLMYADTGTTLENRQVLILEDTATTIPGLITALEGVNFMATATSAGSTATFISTDGGDGFGDHYFNSGWSMIITLDVAGAGAQPEGDVRDIVEYISSTGTFTVAPVWSNSQSTATGDMAIIVRHESLDDYASATHGGSGKIIYVDASQPGTPEPTGDIGDLWDLSYTTIANAIAGATGDNGDVILVAAGHTETLESAQLTWNVAGVRIIGMGIGSTMPIINFNNANSSVDVTAADVYVEGIRFRTTADDVLVGIDIAGTGDGFHIKNCIFDAAAASDEFLETIEFKAAATSNVTIEGCEFYADTTASATEAIISEVGVSDNTKIIGNTFIGYWGVSAVYFSQAHTNMLVKDNVIANYESGEHCFESTAGSTGVFVNNTMHGDTIGAILDPGSLMCTGNVGSISINEAGVTLPLSGDTTGVGEAADGSNLERLEWLQIRSDDILGSLGRDAVADEVFFVDSVASIGGAGTSWATSETTLKAAIDNVTSDVDAVIFVAANHTEEFTASVAIDAPGVTIIGLGQGAARPVFTFNNTAAALTHSVADVRYVNVVFQCTTADSTVAVTLGATSDGAKFTDCEWLSTGAYEFLSSCTLASACDDVEFHGCKFNNLTAGTGDATAAITVTAGIVDGLVIDDCEFYGLWSVAAVISDKACTDVMIRDNSVRNTEPAAFAIEFTAAALGSLINNMLYTDSYGIGLDPGSMACFNNKHVYATDMGAIDVPLVPGKTYTLMSATASVTATTDSIFAIAGGPIRIIDFYGVVTTQVGNSDITIQAIDSATTTTFPYSTTVGCDGDIIGTTYTFSNAIPSVLVPLAGPSNLSDLPSLNWFAPIGTVDQLGDAAVAGVIEWYMTFIPLTTGVVVTDDS